MKSSTWKLNIKWKLLLILLLSGTLSFLLAAVFLVLVEFSNLKDTSRNEINFVAKLISDRSTAALLFHDRALAQENLKALQQTESIINACIYDTHGSVFASLKQDTLTKSGCPTLNPQQQTVFKQLHLHLFEPIYLDQEKIGTIYIFSDLEPAFQQKLQNLSLVLVILLSAVLITFLLTMPLITLIFRPLSSLLSTVRSIASSQDYSLRALKQSSDEVGELVDAFNGMITTVDQQNQLLTSAKDRYLALYDDNPTMIFHLQLNKTIISVNRYGANQLNLTKTELTATTIAKFIHPEDQQLAINLLTTCVNNPQQVHKQELRLCRRDTSTIWVRASARIIVDEHQQQNYLLVCEDVTETRILNEKLIYQARHDTLTGLANRSEFDKYIKNTVKAVHNSHQEHALCYLDLDQFKIVNDTSGHMAGDELLRQLGVLLKQHIRKGDLLARLGGDEFGIVMHNCSAAEAFLICDKLIDVFNDFYFSWEQRRFTLGVSIGIAIINRYSRSAVDVLKAADSACYVAKEHGRNRVHIFRPDDKELATRQGEMQWLEKIQSGIDNNKFQLFGQKIVPLTQTHSGLHFEVLIRYQDDQDNIIPPGAFLPTAERYHKVAELDKWVISTLFKWLASQPTFLDELFLCSINLSGLSLSDENMQAFIAEQFEQWHIPTHKICFEITETAAISNLVCATQFIHYWRNRGCLFSLDDFGSGLSSFAYLKTLPVDFLKIDGLFVKDILTDRVDLAMVKSINEVGHVLGKKTIAEFVEDQAICQRLYEIGVDYAQGYGIAKPVPLDQLITLDSIRCECQ